MQAVPQQQLCINVCVRCVLRVERRADGKGTYFYLPYVKNWSGGNSGEVGHQV